MPSIHGRLINVDGKHNIYDPCTSRERIMLMKRQWKFTISTTFKWQSKYTEPKHSEMEEIVKVNPIDL
jgi:hypothetical protein